MFLKVYTSKFFPKAGESRQKCTIKLQPFLKSRKCHNIDCDCFAVIGIYLAHFKYHKYLISPNIEYSWAISQI